MDLARQLKERIRLKDENAVLHRLLQFRRCLRVNVGLHELCELALLCQRRFCAQRAESVTFRLQRIGAGLILVMGCLEAGLVGSRINGVLCEISSHRGNQRLELSDGRLASSHRRIHIYTQAHTE